MTENSVWQPRHAATVWADILMGLSVQDREGRSLGVVKAVVSSGSGRLYRIGVCAGPEDCRLRFLNAEGADLHDEYVVLPVDANHLEQLARPSRRSAERHFRLFFDRRRRSLLRTL